MRLALHYVLSGDMNNNTAWMILFSQMSRNIDKIPPTQAADNILRDHPTNQGHVGQSLEVQSELPDVTDWGWETSQTAGNIPNWTTLPIAEVACLELISCKCALSLARGMASVSRQTWNAPHFANVVGPDIGDWNYDTWTGILVCAMPLKRTGN